MSQTKSAPINPTAAPRRLPGPSVGRVSVSFRQPYFAPLAEKAKTERRTLSATVALIVEDFFDRQRATKRARSASKPKTQKN